MADVELVLSKVKMYNNHPIPGQLFLDIFPIFRDPQATEAVISHLEKRFHTTYNLSQISAIVCLESRGFYFAPILASRLHLPCVPVRKGGKLPGDVVSVAGVKEYGEDVFEMKKDAFEGIETEGKMVLLVDDLLGKGGSVIAAKKLVEELGCKVAEAWFIFDVPAFLEENKMKLGNLKWYAMVQLTEENAGSIQN